MWKRGTRYRLEPVGGKAGFEENMTNLLRNFAFQMYMGLIEVKMTTNNQLMSGSRDFRSDF